MDVHLGVREVAEPARVVEVEMRDEDLPDVRRVVAEGADLRDGGLLRVQARAEQPARGSQPARVGDVAGAVARVHQDESVGGLDEQAVRDEVPAAPVDEAEHAGGVRAHRPAVEVMDHGQRRRVIVRRYAVRGGDSGARSLPMVPCSPGTVQTGAKTAT